MNKVGILKDNGVLRTDYEFLQKLRIGDDQSQWTMTNSDSKMTQNKFESHPKNFYSDTVTSIQNTENGNIEAGNSTFYLHYYNESLRKQNGPRKQLHSKITTRNDNVLYDIDIGFEEGPKQDFSHSKKIEVLYEKDYKTPKKSVEDEIVTEITSKHVDFKKSLKPHRKPTVTSIKQDLNLSKKIRTLSEKSIKILDEIKIIFNRGISPPDGEEDKARRIVRTKEFASRFSRNYLYPLLRQIEQLEECNKGSTPRGTVNQKLISTYQLIMNGLQTCQNHLPSTFRNGATDKLKEFLKHANKFFIVHERFIDLPNDHTIMEYIDAFKTNSETTLKYINRQSTEASTVSVLKSHPTKINLINTDKSSVLPEKLKLPKKSKSTVQSRLSMYSIPTGFRNLQIKRNMEAWARKKATVSSRYKTSVFKHRPQPGKNDDSNNQDDETKRLFPRRSTSSMSNILSNQMCDDNITTMIQLDNNVETRNNPSEVSLVEEEHEQEVLNTEHIANKLHAIFKTKEILTTLEDKNIAILNSPTKINKLLTECLQNEEGKDVLNRFIKTLEKKESEIAQNEKSNKKEKKNKKKKIHKEPIVQVTGEKNARLICIIDENSICVDTDEDPNHIENKTQLKSCETQTDIVASSEESPTKPPPKQKQKKSVKISRLTKALRKLEMLPTSYAVDIIQYKLDFKTHCKNNTLYVKSENVQPWILMEKISNEILDNILLAVANEIELNETVEKIYQSELQF